MNQLLPQPRNSSSDPLQQVEQALSNHWFARPGFVLIYLFFVFFPLLFSPRADALAWGLSLLASALFVLLFRVSIQGKGQRWPSWLPRA